MHVIEKTSLNLALNIKYKWYSQCALSFVNHNKWVIVCVKAVVIDYPDIYGTVGDLQLLFVCKVWM